jgi:hypothetical protein
MTSIESYIAPIGPNSFTEDLCKTELRKLSFSRGNLLNGNFENIEDVTFGGCIFSESQFFSNGQIQGVRNLQVKFNQPGDDEEPTWSSPDKEKCDLLMKDLKSLRINFVPEIRRKPVNIRYHS